MHCGEGSSSFGLDAKHEHAEDWNRIMCAIKFSSFPTQYLCLPFCRLVSLFVAFIRSGHGRFHRTRLVLVLPSNVPLLPIELMPFPSAIKTMVQFRLHISMPAFVFTLFDTPTPEAT